MRLQDLLRKKGVIEIQIVIRNLPEHMWTSTHLCFTRVPTADSPFPKDDPGAPFHKTDYEVVIAEGPGPISQPLNFRTQRPAGYYYVLLRVMLGRPIQGTMGLQLETFVLSNGAAKVSQDAALRLQGTLTWPSVPDDELHRYGTADELTRQGA